MGNRLAGLLRPVRFKDRVPAGVTTRLALVCVLVPLWSLTAVHADGGQARPTKVQQTEQPPPLRPEQVRFGHISVADGLSEGRVWGITQDRRGFLWFTTYDGINRYDGHEFKVYKHDPQNPNSPASTICRRVLEDSRGMLWFCSLRWRDA